VKNRIRYDNTARDKYKKGMMIKPIAFKIGSKITKAMLLEVVATPKPGLVDRNNSGAHRDMDILTYMKSSAAISQFMTIAAQMGIEHRDDLKELLPKIRSIGLTAEEEMFLVTDKVNTQKGLIFSGMLVAAAAGYLLTRETGGLKVNRILSIVEEITQGIVERELMTLDESTQKITAGEWIFLESGVTGIRGEAEKGFPNAEAAVQVLKKAMESKVPLNDAMIMALLFLMTRVDDTNVLSRHGAEVLTWVKKEANDLVLTDNPYTEEWFEKIKKIDQEFISKNVSPGGCADLLAVALMLYYLTTGL
jgi:triphosphoribosyl-dephospho-CoA synthase CitG